MATIRKLTSTPPDQALGLALVREYTEATAQEMEVPLEVLLPYIPDYDDFPGRYHPHGAFLVIEVDGESAGCLGIAPTPATDAPGSGGRGCEVNRLWIRPAFRQLGLARELVNAALAQAAALGYAKMGLEVLPSRAPAIALYRNLGSTASLWWHWRGTWFRRSGGTAMARTLARAATLLLSALLWCCAPPSPLPKGGLEPPPPSGRSTPPATPTATGETPTVLTGTAPEVATLAQGLVQGRQGEREKALALYQWIAQNVRYDMAAYLADDLPDPSPEAVLSTRLSVCEGYARLFVAMAQQVGLEAEMVAGYSKGFAPDETTSKTEPDHAWNAVKIDGAWQLLDPTWGAGHIDEGKAFKAEYTQDWFAVAPEQFVYTHLPEDPKWQLLDAPRSANTFWAQPSVSPLYFTYGLNLESHPEGTVIADGIVEISVSAQEDCHLMASLTRSGGAPLGGSYALVERRGRDFTISVCPPKSGDYRLVLFAGELSESRAESAVIYKLTARSPGGEGFPKTLQTFSDNEVRLVSPRGVLRHGRSTRLTVEAPGATGVLAVVGEEQLRFEQDGNRFSAEITARGDTVSVCASYDSSSKYSGLLEFPVTP